ncbi:MULTISPECIES: hypothetical protein [unclassified Microcoleus]
MLFRQLFHRESSTYSYLIAAPDTKAAILVAQVLEQVDRDLKLLDELELSLRYCPGGTHLIEHCSSVVSIF